MGIHFDPGEKIFHLKGKDTSYCMQVVRGGYLAHLYWGKRIEKFQNSNPLRFVNRGFSPNPDPTDRRFSLDTLPQEYPAYGNTDFRTPGFQIQTVDGSSITDLRYSSHVIFPGKTKLPGLPATYVESDDEAETLEVVLKDSILKLVVTLTYTVFSHFNVIARSVRFENQGDQPLAILRALSTNVDFRDDEFELVTLYGAHNNERNIIRRPLVPGSQSIESRRGASSHQQNPFFALLRKNADEYQGEVYGFSLVYSGNFLAQVEVDQFHQARASFGINPFNFSWLLEPGQSFQTPEAVMVYSDKGMGGLSRTYHELYRTRLCRGMYRDLLRPILINNWEATYMKFTAEKLLEIAQTASKAGIELFVLDDGWFGRRDNDKTSLGDWVEDKRKLPNGLADLAYKIRKLGMDFGLWFEPEAVSVDSNLYRAHPDWCIQVPGRRLSEGRNELLLDLSRKEVCEYIISSITHILSTVPISYVKWDMNRHMTEIGSLALPPERQRETAHRYMLGLYSILEEITARFPDILFESCSGGGGRFDPGMLYFTPQVWTSDNTDAVSRLKIQYGTSQVYPPITMGAHVSAVPNHQVQRITSLEMRANVAMAGNFGYELDITRLSNKEIEEVKHQVSFYKEIRHIIQFGSFHRLLSPFSGNEAAWLFISADETEIIVEYFRVLSEPNPPLRSLKLAGLMENKRYKHLQTGNIYGGDELMNSGIFVPIEKGDFTAVLLRFELVEI